MNLKTFTGSLIAMAISTSFAAHADNDRYIIQVDNSKKGVVKALAKKLGGQINVDSDGFIAATFTGKDLAEVKGLLNNPHVKLVENDLLRKPMSLWADDAGNPMTQQVTPYAIYQSQANQVNFDASAGMKVCVIDSGLDASNTDFDWGVITGDNDSGTGNWNEHGGPHGTHVAGTIGAADNGYGVVGMAPGVEMHIIKVFSEAGWAYSSDLAYAANKCSNAGANIISMSLGGGGSNSTESNAFQAFSDAGGLVIAAAGNDGNNVRSYPAGYPSVMMVGANDADNNIASFSQFPSCTTGRGKNVSTDETICVEVTAGGVGTLSTYPAGMATAAHAEIDSAPVTVSSMENSGVAYGATYYMGTAEATDSAANGTVCIIDRGNISFHDKVKNCEDSGGIGAILINNEAGMLYGTLGDTNTTSIPAVGAALEDRSAILAAATASVDISASDYGFMDGTSMATPGVSGVAALVWSNFPGCTGQEIRAALKASAMDSGTTGHDEYFGHGIVQAKDAVDYLTANGCAGGNNGGGDNGGGDTGSSDISLSANGYKSKGVKYVDLSWSGATTANVDVYRDGSLIGTTANDGAATDTINTKGGGVYTYQICEEGSTSCSAEMTVVF
jgi:subtilisin family serine protease